MPFADLREGPPSVPSVGCRDGYYWSGNRTNRKVQFPCAYVEVRALSIVQVAATYEGDAQSRARALAALTDGQRLTLYPAQCPGCGQDHAKNAANLLRAWRAIHPDAREACATVPIKDYFRIAACRGATPSETLEAQLLAAAQSAFRRAG